MILRRALTLPRALILLSTVVGALLALGSTAEASPGVFIDTEATSHEAAVRSLVDQGVVAGCTDERFCSRDHLTRGQAATVLARALALPPVPVEVSGRFADTQDNVHAGSIDAVADAGVMSGCGEGRFCPNEPITRAQLATTLHRAFGLEDAPSDVTYFADAGGTHGPAIASITEAGISNGCGLVSFCPSEPLQRAHAAMFIARSMSLVERVAIAPFAERQAEHEAQLEAERLAAVEAAAVAAAARPGNRALEVAMAQLGKPYQWGGNGPNSFDCSGLTSFAWRAAGVELPRTSRQQYAGTTRISRGELRPGDLVFYHSPISHVAIYIGDGRVVEAPNSGTNVRIREDGLTRSGVVGFGRP